MNDQKTFNIVKQIYTNLIIVVGISLLLLYFSCGDGEPKPSSAEDGPTEYEITHIYSHFINGHFSEYVSHIASSKGKPRFYREQLINLYKQQLAEQERTYGRIDSIRVERIIKNADNSHANVYIRKYYSKSNSEEDIIQMCYTENGWAIK
ncbi:MAG: hypothetical protein IKT82_05460 [Bacteroidaceae bacterium]|nr:hypothetical protein [Bacteroidaceae bacterium]